MSDYDNTNRGVLFKNDKDGNEKAPDYKGKVNVAGVEFRLAGWIREKTNGAGKFMSLQVEDARSKKKKADAAEREDF